MVHAGSRSGGTSTHRISGGRARRWLWRACCSELWAVVSAAVIWCRRGPISLASVGSDWIHSCRYVPMFGASGLLGMPMPVEYTGRTKGRGPMIRWASTARSPRGIARRTWGMDRMAIAAGVANLLVRWSRMKLLLTALPRPLGGPGVRVGWAGVVLAPASA